MGTLSCLNVKPKPDPNISYGNHIRLAPFEGPFLPWLCVEAEHNEMLKLAGVTRFYCILSWKGDLYIQPI